MSLAQLIAASSQQIIGEWEEFARTAFAAATLKERRDQVEGMLRGIALDLATPQNSEEQAEKSQGKDDSQSDGRTAAHSHGTDRAAAGYTPGEIVAEFRALRASVLRLWRQSRETFTQGHIEEVTRFNESIDQLLAQSMARWSKRRLANWPASMMPVGDCEVESLCRPSAVAKPSQQMKHPHTWASGGIRSGRFVTGV